MVLNAAVQMLREADELKQKILKFKSGTSMLQERSLWATQQQLQKVYQKLLLLDLDYALDKKVEQDLWNVGFKQQIEALQAISKDRKNALRSEGQAMLSWVLQAAAGFYLCLLHQICTAFKLDLPFRRRASLLGWVSGWGTGPAGSPAPPAHARYICQHCLVHLGDLARYRQQPRLAHTFYRHALVVSVHCGQPYNQLALVWWRRGRRLCALYWHVRSLLVRAPFPPAPANLARTLQHAACAAGRPRDLPVLPGVAGGAAGGAVSGAGGGAGGGAACGEVGGAGGSSLPRRLDAHAYVNEFIRALHLIHTLEELDTAATIVDTLNSSLGPLIATESFESMTLIKMAVLVIWLVHSSCEEWQASGAQTPREQAAAALSLQLAAGAVLATALPAACAEPPRAALKVWLQWVLQHPQVAASAAWRARPQLWAALAHALNGMAPADGAHAAMATVPLPEDEELHGFLPLEASLRALRFPNHACWDSYGDRVPVADDKDFDRALGPGALAASPELQAKLRATRLRELGVQLADLHAPHLSYTEENGVIVFSSPCLGADDLTAALAELSAAGGDGGDPAARGEAGGEQEDSADGEGGEEVRVGPPPPVIISEAHFREKVREKRVGILKPQGSLERAREERAMANTQPDEPEVIDEESKTEDKKENRKPRVNIAMAAIMRKQEEVNKQVKFVSPPPSTPDSAVDSGDSKDDKPKVVQPKPVKSLANLPVGRKTGGILSLKDKSAGYPHLQKTDPEPKKDKEEKKEMKSSQCSQNSQQNYQPKRLDAPNTNWTTNYGDPRGGFPKAYGIQNQVGYSPGGLRLPVVNPKEIDVRSAALQKQSSRADLFPDGHRFAAGHPLSGDKKSFLSDLPPRFANQYRHWQGAQENQYSDNKFRDDAAPSAPHPAPRPAWPQQETYQQPMSWWKPDSAPPPNYNPNFSTQMNPNFYPSVPTYQTAFNPPTQPPQQKPDLMPSYLSQPPMHTLQNLVTSPSFSSSMSGFSSFGPSVSYDSSMYPQFNKPYPMKMDPKPSFQGNKEMLDMGLGFGANLDLQRNMNFNERADNGAMKSLDQAGQSMDMAATGLSVVAEPGNTYSLFSGADPHTWASPQVHNPQGQQSLWSGPGPSPLERLLEQQRQRAPQ